MAFYLRICALLMVSACPGLYALDVCSIVLAAPEDVAIRAPLVNRLSESIVHDRYSNALSEIMLRSFELAQAQGLTLDSRGVLFASNIVPHFAVLRAGLADSSFSNLSYEQRVTVLRKFAVDVTDTESLILASRKPWFEQVPSGDYELQQEIFRVLQLDRGALDLWIKTAIKVELDQSGFRIF